MRVTAGRGISLWIGVCGLAACAFGQSVPASGAIPSLTYSSGGATCQASNSLTAANGFVVSGSGTAVFQAGSLIDLKPGFHATAGSSGTTFDAKIVSPPITPALAVGAQTLPGGAIQQTYPTQTLTATGGCGSVTWSVSSGALPGGLTLNAATGAIGGTVTAAGLFSFGIAAQDSIGTVSAARSFSIAVTGAPVISLANPANGGNVWGAVDVSGYALENAPGLHDPISAVKVTIASNDGTGLIVNGTATYPNAMVARNDICGASGPYPNAPGCPYVQFDYTWTTGLAPDGVTFLPNGSYTVTATALDSSAPQLSSSASATVTVDNQPPSPVIVGPVNGNGAYAPAVQTFTVSYLSPHTGLDFSYGQIVFAGPSATCVAQWTLGGGISLQSQANGAASPCTMASTGSSVTTI